MAKRIKYYYDTESCQYVRASLSWKTIGYNLWSHLLTSGLFAVIVLVLLYLFFDSPTEELLKNENASMGTRIGAMKSQLDEAETNLFALHGEDKTLYKSMLNADPLDTIQLLLSEGTTADDDEITVQGEDLDSATVNLDKINKKLDKTSKEYAELYAQISKQKEALKRMPSIRPIRNGLIISGFGDRKNPFLSVTKHHGGIDFQAPEGTAVVATADGTITDSGTGENGMGMFIEINHGLGYVTRYAHLSKVQVKNGQKVMRGQLIGLTGNTGLSKGPHLHYEVLHKGKKINPIDFFYADLDGDAFIEFKKQADQVNESMD